MEVRSCKHCFIGKAVRVTYLWVCVCSLWYPACKENAPCCHLWPARLYHINAHYFINGAIFGKRLLNIKCALIFTSFDRNISHSKKNSARCYHKCTQAFMQITRYSSQISINLEFFEQIFKSSNAKFYENPSSGSRIVRYGKTYTKNLTAAFCTLANWPK